MIEGRSRIRILFVTPYVPSRLRVRPLSLVRGLSAAGHRVTVIAAATSRRELEDAHALRSVCERVRVAPVTRRRAAWNCLRAAGTGVPLQALFCDSPAWRRLVRDELREDPRAPYDLLHVEHIRAAGPVVDVRGLPRVFDAVDCISRLLARTWTQGWTLRSRLGALVELRRTQRFERELLDRFERVVTTSPADRDALVALGAGIRGSEADRAARRPIEVVGNGVDLDYFTPQATERDPATLVCVGRMAYHANVAAVLYLVRDVMPRVWRERPDARVIVVGSDPPRQLRALAARHGPRLEVTGHVPDVRPYLARCTVSVSPLVYAVGVQNKVLEALAMATPVVATPECTAALAARPGEHLLVGADPAALAAQVLALLRDPGARLRLGQAGRRYVEANHDWRESVRRLVTIYRHVLERFRGERRSPPP